MKSIGSSTTQSLLACFSALLSKSLKEDLEGGKMSFYLQSIQDPGCLGDVKAVFQWQLSCTQRIPLQIWSLFTAWGTDEQSFLISRLWYSYKKKTPSITYWWQNEIIFLWHEECFWGTEPEGGINLLENTTEILCPYKGGISRDIFVCLSNLIGLWRNTTTLSLGCRCPDAKLCESPKHPWHLWLLCTELELPQPGPGPHQSTTKVQLTCSVDPAHQISKHWQEWMSPSQIVLSAQGSGMGFTFYGWMSNTLTQEAKNLCPRSASAKETQTHTSSEKSTIWVISNGKNVLFLFS